MKRARMVFGVAMAVVLVMSAAAFAQGVAPAAAPVKPPAAPKPLPASAIPQFAQPLDVLDIGGANTGLRVIAESGFAGASAATLSICEYQAYVLPPGTITKGVSTPTWVWGYVKGEVCPNQPATHSYLGPIVIADRGKPTAMTFVNKLPGNVNTSNVNAYKLSTDTTLIWGDPLSLKTNPPPVTLIDGSVPWAPTIDPATDVPNAPRPEDNLCYLSAQNFVALGALPAPCGFNYGVTAIAPGTYTAPVPAAVHIHGGEVPPVLDGGPDAWWTPNGIYGHGYYTRTVFYQLPIFRANAADFPPATFPAGTLAQAAGKVYESNGVSWVLTDAAPFAPGQLVYLDWLDPNQANGYHLLGNLTDPLPWTSVSPDRATYVYPNAQEAAPVWFHDHMLGATRLNVYAGIAGGYVIKEPPATLATGLHPLGLVYSTSGLLPTVPLIIQDRMFDTNGQLFFPAAGINPEHPFWVPEFVGDTICVNGKAWPYFEVTPNLYRFLFLNGSNARSYELWFPKGPKMYVIGNDQGYLDAPQLIDPAAAVNNKLTMMPGERYEVLIDFSLVAAGTNLVLENTARTPWVGGAPVNGRTTGRIMQFRVKAATTDPVYTPTGTTFNPAAVGATVRATPMKRLVDVNLAAVPPTSVPAQGVTIHKTRRLTLNEVIAKGGPLEILVNNTLYDGSKPRPQFNDFTQIDTMWNSTWYSELPHEGETELWEIVNLTADAHPMHPHLVAFQVLDRIPLNVPVYLAAYNTAYAAAGLPIDGYGPPMDYSCDIRDWDNDPNTPPTPVPPRGVIDPATCVFGGNPDPIQVGAAVANTSVAPAPQEIGWKDTVQALPNMITRILVRFAPPTAPIAANNSNTIGYDFSPNHGHGYVWHCHIVDHEDNEMMRPYSVWANPGVMHNYVMGVNY